MRESTYLHLVLLHGKADGDHVGGEVGRRGQSNQGDVIRGLPRRFLVGFVVGHSFDLDLKELLAPSLCDR